MAHGEEPTRIPSVVVGLSLEEGGASTRDYFAAFRWEPPLIDPVCLTASAFLALLDDLAGERSPPG